MVRGVLGDMGGVPRLIIYVCDNNTYRNHKQFNPISGFRQAPALIILDGYLIQENQI